MSYLKRGRQMRGDVVLFKSNGSFTDRLISWGTHGPYVHVEIDLGNGKFLGSQEKGVNIHGFEKGRYTQVFSPQASKQNIESGLAWAIRQVNDPYSYLDNVAAAMEDPSWEDTHEHPTLDIGFGMFEQDALLVLVRSMQQHGARVLVVSSREAPIASGSAEKPVVRPVAKVKKDIEK